MTANPKASQPCKYCNRSASRSLIWGEGTAYIPVCNAHESAARRRLRLHGEGVDDVVSCSQEPMAYRESAQFRMERALQPVPVYIDDDVEPSFGLRVSPLRGRSVLAEAPVAPIGRASTPRGAVFQSRGKSSPDTMRVSSKPITRIGKGSKAIRKRTSAPGYISNREIPDSLFQMLGTDWKTLHATRVHDNRITMSIDGVRFSVYTRRG